MHRNETLPQQRSTAMRHTRIAGLVGVLMAVAAVDVAAQVAGSTTPGISVEELKTLARGWSVTKQILGQSVLQLQQREGRGGR